jgi:hypothetical protein
MPCRDYWSDTYDTKRNHEATILKERCDQLARIACKAMYALEQLDPELKSFKDHESRKWWADHKKADQARLEKEQKESAKRVAKQKLVKEALSKLTPEEIEAFGLNVKVKTRAKSFKIEY